MCQAHFFYSSGLLRAAFTEYIGLKQMKIPLSLTQEERSLVLGEAQTLSTLKLCDQGLKPKAESASEKTTWFSPSGSDSHRVTSLCLSLWFSSITC